MIALLSPAKTLDWSPAPAQLPSTAPRLADDARVLADRCRRLDVDALRGLMDLSGELAELNHQRFQAMGGAERRPAALAFAGGVYQGLDARTLTPEDLSWAQDHLVILSGLYGLLRPLDAIEPYRLEMGTALRTRRGDDLYAFWGDRVTVQLKRQLRGHASPCVVNLASNEYWRVVVRRKLGARVVTPVFKEVLPDGRLQSVSFFAKWARGAMARFMIERRLDAPEALQGFTGGGYAFQPGLSEGDTWTFTRPKPPPVSP